MVKETRDYLGALEYSNGALEAIYHEEGRAIPENGTWKHNYLIRDHLGNTRVVFENDGTGTARIVESSAYYPFGTAFEEENDYPYLFGGKELNNDFGLDWYDHGARWRDPWTTLWGQVDPLAEKYDSWSPYNFALNNPLKFADPDGRTPSTHTDENGNVIAVYDDGDLGVYKHENNTGGTAPTKNDIDEEHEKSTSAGGKKMGETEYWDEFITPGTNRAEGTIYFGQTQAWDPLLDWANNHANNQDLSITMEESKLNQNLDIKNNRDWAPDGPMTGRLLNGKYATARSAGNYLAGMNGVTGTFQGQRISGTTYMKIAGAYQVGQLSKVNIIKIISMGTSFGPPPYYGEQPYSGRRILEGIAAGYKKIKK